MHIPDGFVSAPVNAAGYLVSAGVVSLAVRRANTSLEEHQVPLLGVTAAFIFAAQMVNFPVAAGTSGHVLGALLAALLLGPLNACLVMAVVLGMQCLLFADGGLTALGTNVFNMGIVGGMFAYLVFAAIRSVTPGTLWWFLFAAGVASWSSVVAGSAACALELALSGTVPVTVALPAMLGVHAFIGIGEAVVTVTTLSAVIAARPDLVRAWSGSGGLVSAVEVEA
jgi:cobalt/nickel transport system permease protein